MKRWYVAQVYAGYEEVVQKDLLRRINETNDQRFGQFLFHLFGLKVFLRLRKRVKMNVFFQVTF